MNMQIKARALSALAEMRRRRDKCLDYIQRYQRDIMLLVVGIILVSVGLEYHALAQLDNSNINADYQPDRIVAAVGGLFQLIEGSFGALIMVVAGIVAIVSAAMGAYRAAMGMVVVALGAFILRSLVSLFFGPDFGTTPSDLVGSVAGG